MDIEKQSQKTHPIAAVLVFCGIAAALLIPSARSLALVMLALLTLVSLHELGHFIAARKLNLDAPEFSVGFGPVLFQRKSSRTTYNWRAVPLGGYVRLKGLSPEAPTDATSDGGSWEDLPHWKQVVVAFAGPFANVLVAIFLIFIAFGVVGISAPSTKIIPAEASPAAQAGLQENDQLISLNGHDVSRWRDVRTALEGYTSGPVDLVVRRGDTFQEVKLTPAPDKDNIPRIGVRPVYELQKLSTDEALLGSFQTAWGLTTASASSIPAIFTSVSALPSRFAGTVPEDDSSRLVSPVGAAAMAEQSQTSLGPGGPLLLLASASMFLALFNLLPLPPLDGGHIAIALYEAAASRLKKRKVSVDRAKLQPIAIVVIMFVLVAGVGTLLADIVSPVKF